MTRVLVVDDHDFFRGCLVDLVNAKVGEMSAYTGAGIPQFIPALTVPENWSLLAEASATLAGVARPRSSKNAARVSCAV